MHRNQLDAVMAEAGRLRDFLAVRPLDGEAAWQIAVEPGEEVFADLVVERGTLLLSALVGPAVEPEAVARLALAFSCAAARDGRRLGLEPGSDRYWLYADLPATGWDASRLGAAIAAFAEAAAAWRGLARTRGAAAPAIVPAYDLSGLTLLRA